ncbi:hypothetical protein ABZ725_28360 [Streptomyces sp. NPDC006872]|uniref:hypothetical protein n=1 Tax=Streptomyces sp. NPDC006872 TaxID=3155720 RepID=UPI0033CC4A92
MTTARELTEVAVPRFADHVSVDLLDPVFHGELPAPVLPRNSAVLRRAAHRSAFSQPPEVGPSLGEAHRHPSPGLLREGGRGPLEDLRVLSQSAVLPPQRGQFLAFAAGRASALGRVGLGLADPQAAPLISDVRQSGSSLVAI